MWKQLVELARQLFTLGRETQQNREAIRELQEHLVRQDEQMRALTDIVHRLAFELERLRENEGHERDKLVLRLDNTLLRFERRLPPAGRSDDAAEDER